MPNTLPPLYDPAAVIPMWEELEYLGVRSLRTPEEVDEAIKQPGTTLVVINSVCGCAAGNARPGVALALQHTTIPDHLTTAFAGVDRDATDRARSYMPDIRPSSPSIALFKDGQPVFVMERRHIEQMMAEGVADILKRGFDTHCSAMGPSISPEKFNGYVNAKMCGSKIPRFQS